MREKIEGKREIKKKDLNWKKIIVNRQKKIGANNKYHISTIESIRIYYEYKYFYSENEIKIN